MYVFVPLKVIGLGFDAKMQVIFLVGFVMHALSA
jgi:hypothetical protein